METFALFRLGEKRPEDFARERLRETGVQSRAAGFTSSITGFDEMRDPKSGSKSS
jgi:hypothetical protein